MAADGGSQTDTVGKATGVNNQMMIGAGFGHVQTKPNSAQGPILFSPEGSPANMAMGSKGDHQLDSKFDDTEDSLMLPMVGSHASEDKEMVAAGNQANVVVPGGS